MAEPNNTPRPQSPAASASERTPLLSTGAGEPSIPQQSSEQAAALPSSDVENGDSDISTSQTFRFIKLATYVSLISSIICLVLLLATYITGEMSPYNSYIWWVHGVIAQLGIFMFLSTTLSILNLGTMLRPRPHQPSAASMSPFSIPHTTFFYFPVALLIDLLFVLFILNFAGRLSSGVSLPSYCYRYSSLDLENCESWRLALRILCGASVCIAAVVGLVYLVLFVLRCFVAFHSGLWPRPVPWNLPLTGLTVQFTVKFLSRESRDDN